MSNNYDDDDDFVRPKKKTTPILPYTLIGVLLLALAGGVYYVFFFQNFTLVNEPVSQRPTQTRTQTTQEQTNTRAHQLPTTEDSLQSSQSPNNTINNQENTEVQNQELSLQNNTQNQGATNTLNSPAFISNNVQETHTSLNNDAELNTTSSIDDILNSRRSQTQETQEVVQHPPRISTENELIVHEMGTNNDNRSNANRPGSNVTSNSSQIRANTTELNANTNTFELVAPQNSGQNIHIASEEELTKRREQAGQNRLAQLESARYEQESLARQLTDEQKQAIASTNTMSLSNTTASELSNDDPTITQLFLHSMATMLVNNYNPAQNSVATNTISASKLSQYFGTTLRGLNHPKGRIGVFEYVYQPQMITKVADYMTPRLITEMSKVAYQKGFSKSQEVAMYHTYAIHITDTANILNAVIQTPNIKPLIEQTLSKEKILLAKKEEFAEILIAFESTKLEHKDTTSLEKRMQDISKEVANIEQEYLVSKRLVINAVFNAFPETQKIAMSPQARQEEIYDLALWTFRRNNINADKAAVSALSKFASTLRGQ